MYVCWSVNCFVHHAGYCLLNHSLLFLLLFENADLNCNSQTNCSETYHNAIMVSNHFQHWLNCAKKRTFFAFWICSKLEFQQDMLCNRKLVSNLHFIFDRKLAKPTETKSPNSMWNEVLIGMFMLWLAIFSGRAVCMHYDVVSTSYELSMNILLDVGLSALNFAGTINCVMLDRLVVRANIWISIYPIHRSACFASHWHHLYFFHLYYDTVNYGYQKSRVLSNSAN